MGINKLPETGDTHFLPQPKEKKKNVPRKTKQLATDKMSARSGVLKSRSVQQDHLSKKKNIKDTSTNRNNYRVVSPENPYLDPGMHWESKDILTGESFSDLARKSFEKSRPYCFAVAIATNEKASGKKKIIMDGSEFLQLVDVEKLKIPCSVILHPKGKAEFLHDVQFFAVRENKTPERISSVAEATHGPDSTILTCLIIQEDDDIFESVGNATNVIVASIYSAGIGVAKDEEYAKKVMSKITKEDKYDLSPELFSFALANEEDTRLAEFLIVNGFDPNVRDPEEGSTSIQMADYHGRKEMLRLFEKYGYYLEG